MSDVLADALLDIVGRASTSLRARAAECIGLAADFLRPSEELELMTSDGRRYTGFVLMTEGRVLALLAVEARPQRRTYYNRGYAPEWDDGLYED